MTISCSGCALSTALSRYARGGARLVIWTGLPRRRLDGASRPWGCSVTSAGSACCCSWSGNRPAALDLKTESGQLARGYLVLIVGSALIWLASHDAVDWFCESV